MTISNPDDEKRRADAELAQINLRAARKREAEESRQEELATRRAEETAREENKRRDEEERRKKTLGGRIQGVRDTVNEKKDAFVNRATEITINTAKSKKFWSIFLLGLILFISAYYNNFFGFRTYLLAFLLGVGITIAGLIAIIFIIIFIVWGFVTGLTKNDNSRLFIAGALLVWMVDLAPEWIIPWPPYAGFELPLSFGVWSLSLLPVLTSSFTFALLYINMVLKIIKKEYIYFSLAFLLILITNYIFPKILPNSYLNINFSVPGLPLIFIIVVMITVGIVWYFHKKSASAEISEFFSSLWMIFVFSFFWINNGWQNNGRAWIHVIYIILFGFVYIKSKEKNNPAVYNILFPALLLIDFFGYGFLWNSDLLALRTLPPLVIFVICYCYVKESNEVDGQKKATYPVMAFILLVTFFLIMTVKVAGIQENSLPFIAKQGATFKDFYSQFTDNLKQLIEGRLDLATAGLYRGSVEKNRYESLGVYFANIRASDPRFYTDEPITVWSSIRSKTYKDPVIINFSCYRWKDNKRIYADKSVPSIKFPIFQLEEVDAECTFLPPKKEEKAKEYAIGANTVTLSAEYNFATDSYLKAYFIDRDRFKSYSREAIEPLAEFGIKDKKPAAVHTNGPVEIGIGAGPLIPVSSDYAVKPVVGITLTNRKEISDKDKRIVQKWDGKIKNITELVLLTPPGITLEGNDPKAMDSCKLSKTDPERLKCPCNFAFNRYTLGDCFGSCTNNIVVPCTVTCSNVYEKDEKSRNLCITDCQNNFANCNTECKNLFSTGEGEGSGNYNAYALDVGSIELRDLNKDIDKSRTFVCRYTPTPGVLDSTPITTRYFRVRARYNYVAENSVTVNVEKPPVETKEFIPPDEFKTINDYISLRYDMVSAGITNELILAIANVESNRRHCCKDAGKTNAGNCEKVSEEKCEPDRVIKSYDGSSVGFMQINKIHEGMAKPPVCSAGQTIYDKECNIHVGEEILKSNYDKFKNGIKPEKLAKFCPPNEQPERYQKYLSYRGIYAAIRAYNGWGCRPESGCQKACANARDSALCVRNCILGTVDYVENVIKARNSIKGPEIIDSTTFRTTAPTETTPIKDEYEEATTEVTPSSATPTTTTEAGGIPAPATGQFAIDTAGASQSITVFWKPSPTPDVKYKIVRCGPSVCDILIDGYGGTVLQDSGLIRYIDTKEVQNYVNYFYRISAVNSNGESGAAQTAQAISNEQ